ncbi:MAG: DUF6900 domain-containing protein [bacterium]
MSGLEFFRTAIGHRFFEHTMPRLVEELGHLCKVLERIVELVRAGDAPVGVRLPSDVPVTAWTVTLLEIAAKHLRIGSFEPEGSDRLDFHHVHVAAVGAALRAAYRAGIAAGVRHVRLDDCESERSPDHER